MPVFAPNRYKGKLVVVEGIDGSGKSTQISLLSHWLRSQGYAVAFSEWNSSPLVRQATRRGKKKEMFTPTTFSLIHATDFADRTERYILPLIRAGAIVCADRYAYTAFARDVARGVDPRWVRNRFRSSGPQSRLRQDEQREYEKDHGHCGGVRRERAVRDRGSVAGPGERGMAEAV